MKIFITGIAGFLGSHLADRMISLGHEVSGNDTLIGGYIDNINPRAKFYQIDCFYGYFILEGIGNTFQFELRDDNINYLIFLIPLLFHEFRLIFLQILLSNLRTMYYHILIYIYIILLTITIIHILIKI